MGMAKYFEDNMEIMEERYDIKSNSYEKNYGVVMKNIVSTQNGLR